VIYDLEGDENLRTSATFDTVKVRQWIAGQSANVEITDKCPECVVSRRYDERFLRSEVRDQFTLTACIGDALCAPAVFGWWGGALGGRRPCARQS
jgi:hypothetical protein